MSNYTKITFDSGAVLGSAETRTLFDSTVAFPGESMHQMAGLHRFTVHILNDEILTLNIQSSQNRGTSWTSVDSVALAVPSAGDGNLTDFVIEPHHDFRIQAVGGGTIQGTWVVNMSMSDGRASTV